MELEKCERCGKDIYGSIEGTTFCVKHYVENYKKDRRFLEYKLNQLLDYFSRGQGLTDKEKSLLKEIKLQFPEIIGEYAILFEEIED